MQSDVLNDSIANLATLIIAFGFVITTGIYIVSLKRYKSAAPFKFLAQMIIMISLVVSLSAYLFINKVTANSVIVVTAGFAGLILGMLLFGTRKIFVYKGRVEIKRAVSPILLIMVAYLASSFFNVLGNSNLMSLGVIAVVFATGIAMGSVTADSINGITMDSSRSNKRIGTSKDRSGNEIENDDDSNGPLPI